MKKKGILLAAILVLMLAVLSACSSGGNDVSNTYNQALSSMKNGEFAKAAEALNKISFYEDSVLLSQYCRAHAYAAEGDFDAALSLFSTFAGYRDSAQWCDYYFAKSMETAADSPGSRAYAAYLYGKESLREFQDAAVRAESIRSALYREGSEAEENEEWRKASEFFGALDSYLDSNIRHSYVRGRANEISGEKSPISYISAIADYEEAGSYKDSKDRIENCVEAVYTKADQLIEAKDFDSAEQLYIALGEHCDKSKLPELERAREKAAEEERRLKYEKAASLLEEGKNEEAAALYLQIIDYKDCRQLLYEIADKASAEKQYPLSIAVFDGLGETEDCKLRMTNDLYLYGRQLLEDGQNADAVGVFDRVSGIGSADLYANMARYAAAEKLEEEGAYKRAAEAFEQIAEYEDSKDRALKCRYSYGLEEKKAGNYENAAAVFKALGDYEDSRELEKDSRYLLAGRYEETKKWTDAIRYFEALGGYKDSRTRSKVCYISLGKEQLAAGDADAAYRSFLEGGDTDGQKKAAFAIAEGKITEFNLKDALEWYQKASDLPETETRTAMIAESLLNMEEDEMSEAYASVVSESEKSREILYALAIRSLERQDEDAAMRQLQKAGDSADASERFREMLKARVETLVAGGKYDEAADLCASYGDQEQADALLKQKAEKEEQERQRIAEENREKHQAQINEANALLEKEEYDQAAAIFTEIGETELAENALVLKAAAEEAKRAAEEEEKREKQRAREEEGKNLLEAGDFDSAMEIFTELENQELINETIYRKAAALDQPGLYLEIPDYKDSREKHYQAGIALLDSDPENAYRILAGDISYRDAQSVLYTLADRESAAGNYPLSFAVFTFLGQQPLDPSDLKPDCSMRAYQDMYQYGLALQAQGEWQLAADVFDHLKGLSKAELHSNEAYYAIASDLEKNEKYSQAALSFEALGDYSDSAERAKLNRYQAAKKQMEAEEYEAAAKAFFALDNYNGSTEMAMICRYLAAQKQMESGEYEAAEKSFEALDDYSDSAEMAKECRYLRAKELQENGDYSSAMNLFGSLDQYKDSADQKKECIYVIADGLADSSDYPGAIEWYSSIKDYKDASDKILRCYETLGDRMTGQANEKLNSNTKEAAIKNYKTAYDYYEKAGSSEKCVSTALLIGSCYQSMDDYSTAVDWYWKAGDNGKANIAGIATYALQTEQEEAAESLALKLDSDEGKAILYRMAEMNLDSGKEEEALRRFGEAGDYQDAPERYSSLKYQIAEEKIAAGEFEEAEKLANELGGTYYQELIYSLAARQQELGNTEEALRLFDTIGEYLESRDRHDEILYQEAAEQIAGGDYIAAIETLGKIPDYKDTAAKKKEAMYQVALGGTDGKTDDPDAGRIVFESRMLYVNDMIAAEDYAAAISVLEKMEQTQEIAELLQSVRYRHAEKLENEGKLAEAIEGYEFLGDYADAALRADKAQYRLAMDYKKDQQYSEAITILEKIPDYEDARDQVTECTYLLAGKLAEEGAFDKALAVYQGIIDYSDVRSILASDKELNAALIKWQRKIKASDRVILGHRETGENISWLVLDHDGDKLLLISEELLEKGPFMEGKLTRTTWQHSTLRKKLNEEWITRLFSEDERKGIQLTKVIAERSSGSKVSPGNNTEDYLFVLNEQEAKKYEKYLKEAPVDESWWLRSPAKENNTIELCGGNGKTVNDDMANGEHGIRPVLWVDEKTIFANTVPEETADEVKSEQKEVSTSTAEYKAWDIIKIGSYKLDSNQKNGEKPIEWIVLDIQGDRALLLSRYGLDVKLYNEKSGDVSWETCSIRGWLNGEFLSTAFSTEEMSAILLADVDNSASQGYEEWQTEGGNNTQDRIFLLSYAEANKYLGVAKGESNVKARAHATAYARKQGAYNDSSNKTEEGVGSTFWWLRSPGSTQSNAAGVSYGGSLRDINVDYDRGVARPAFWIKLEYLTSVKQDV